MMGVAEVIKDGSEWKGRVSKGKVLNGSVRRGEYLKGSGIRERGSKVGTKYRDAVPCRNQCG